MASNLQVHSQFTVSSGCLSYGDLHNMLHGLTMPVQPFPAALDQKTGGTVKAQILHYNIAAQNGTWLAHELKDSKSNMTVGWFVCHSDVEPETEVDKILRVSGSPYENDSGSQWHSEKTVAEGVLPINRYDWAWYDSRCQDEIPQQTDEEESDWYGMDLGLADFGHAKEYIDNWKNVKPHQRENQPHSIWMCIELEYMFGRFGFNDEHTAARSFLWFTSDTDFTRTVFAGTERTLRVFESPADRFQRLIREKYNFDGLELIYSMISWDEKTRRVPPETELLGPYNKNDYVLHAEYLDATRTAITARVASVPDFVTEWKSSCIELINEIILSYLEKFVAPAVSAHKTITEAAAALFPEQAKEKTVDKFMYEYMTDPSRISMDANRAAVGEKMKAFLTPKCGEGSLIRDDLFIQGLVGGVEWLVSEVLELSNNCRDHGQSGIVPLHIRNSFFWDVDLFRIFRFSKVYWRGGEAGWGAEGVVDEREEL